MFKGNARRRRGFTLLELLTVTSIAIVLGTLIVTAIFAAQEAARNVNCRSNLSQVHKLMMVYTQSYGQFLPAFWHERWVGELGLAGGQWRPHVAALRKRPDIKPMWDNWKVFLNTPGAMTFPPPSAVGSGAKGYTQWRVILYQLYKVYNGTAGYPKVDNIDDVNPCMPMVWNNYQTPGHYLGNASSSGFSAMERSVFRSSAQVILCPSDTSEYRCDQGALVSYMGVAKYGWWHRGDCPTVARYYEYHQIQEVVNPSRGLLLAETEPGTWQFGGCG